MYQVYKIFDEIDKTPRYIGCTKNFIKRWLKHISDSRHPKNEKDLWLKDRIDKNICVYMLTIEMIEAKEQAYACERYWINHYRVIGAPLFNIYYDKPLPIIEQGKPNHAISEK